MGRVLAGLGASIPRGDDPAVGGRGQRGDAMALESIQPGRGQARDLTDRVVLGGFHRVRLSCTRTGKHGDGLGSGGNSTGDDVVSVAVTGRRPRRGRREGTGGQVGLGDRVGRGLALLGRVRGEVVPAAVRRAGRQDAREVRFLREYGQSTVSLVRVGEGEGEDVPHIYLVPEGVCTRCGNGDRRWGCFACRGRGGVAGLGVTFGGCQCRQRERRTQECSA